MMHDRDSSDTSWLELSLTLSAEQRGDVELALDDLGALAITLSDAEDDPIFEPAPGETPLWPTVVLTALFEGDRDRATLVHALADLVPGLDGSQVGFAEVADQEWTRVWMDQFQPMRFGRRLWIYPSTIPAPDEFREAVVVHLDPGMAFGTGTHATTALCLQWLDGLDLVGKTVIDYGCGSGVLGIAAIKLGAAHVIGVDNDPQALQASAENARRNHVEDRLELCLPQAFGEPLADVLVANILAEPLIELEPLFRRCLRPGGLIALSGILTGQQHEVIQRYSEHFGQIEAVEQEEWQRISGVRES